MMSDQQQLMRTLSAYLDRADESLEAIQDEPDQLMALTLVSQALAFVDRVATELAPLSPVNSATLLSTQRMALNERCADIRAVAAMWRHVTDGGKQHRD